MATPGIPAKNAGELYVNGLGLSNDGTTPDELLSIAAGDCRDSTNANDISLSAAVTVSNVLSGAGGLDTGTVAASIWYTVYLLGDSTGYNATAGILSVALPAAGPVLPGGYDMFRHVGWVCTDATSDFLPFNQVGAGQDRWHYADGPVAVLAAGADAAFTDVDCNASVPPAMPNLATSVVMDLLYTPNGAGDTADFRVNGSADANGSVQIGTGVAAAQRITAPMQTDANATFEYHVTGGDTLSINIVGYQFSLDT